MLSVRRVGTQRIYRLERQALEEARDWLSEQAERWSRVLDAVESALDEGRL